MWAFAQRAGWHIAKANRIVATADRHLALVAVNEGAIRPNGVRAACRMAYRAEVRMAYRQYCQPYKSQRFLLTKLHLTTAIARTITDEFGVANFINYLSMCIPRE